MTQATNGIILRAFALFGLVSLVMACVDVSAAPPEGAWKFERSLDYYGRIAVNESPKFSDLLIGSKQIKLSDICSARFAQENYAYAETFQPLSKAGVTPKQLDKFLKKGFGFSLERTEIVYTFTSSPGNCAGPVMEFFHVGDRLLIPVGATFYSYIRDPTKIDSGVSSSGKGAEPYAAYRRTPLPMDFDRYYSQCLPKILSGNRHPRTTGLCAPDYFPYIAEENNNDALMRLIGYHDYIKGGSEYAGSFSPPFKQGTIATFLIFPSFKQVTLVRVDDFEIVRNEERDVMSGVYLTIKNGKVIDQLNENCMIDESYACIGEDGKKHYQLLQSGEFKKH